MIEFFLGSTFFLLFELKEFYDILPEEFIGDAIELRLFYRFKEFSLDARRDLSCNGLLAFIEPVTAPSLLTLLTPL